MRVVLVGQAYPPRINGPAVFMQNLARALADRGHDVLVLAPSERARSYERVDGRVRHVALPSFPLGIAGVRITLHAGPEIDDLFDDFRPDVVHLQDHYPTSRSALRRARRRGLPVVGTNHFLPENLALQLPWPLRSSRWVERVLWWTVGPVLRRLDAVAVPSRTAAALLEEHWPGLAPRPISCGVDLRRFHPRGSGERAAVRERHGLALDRTVALYVGRLDSDKSVDVLVRAWRQLGDLPAQLVLVGGGLEEDHLRTLARDAGDPSSVVFAGQVPDDDLPLLYAAADLFVMPSTIELQSIATLEAMATELPVLAADAGALPELVHEEVTGLRFRPGDPEALRHALRRLLVDADARARFGRSGLERVREHAVERSAERYEALYREAIGARAGGGDATTGGSADGDGAERHRVVVTADDFGAAPDINRAVLAAHRAGTLTSTSLEVTGEAAAEAVELARATPTLAVGLHLVLVKGRAASDPARIPHLVDADGNFARDPVRAGLRYFFDRRARRELAIEIEAQFERFAATGLPLSHVDGHMHMHVHPVVFALAVPLAERYGAAGIRLPRDDLRLALRHDRQGVRVKLGWALAFGLITRWCAARLPAALRAPERCYGLMETGHMGVPYVRDVLASLTTATAELYFHPAEEPHPDHDGPSPTDLATLLDASVARAFDAPGIERTTYRGLHERPAPAETLGPPPPRPAEPGQGDAARGMSRG